MAKVLGMTPTDLRNEMHSGKTLEEIAKSKGVDVKKVQEAGKAAELAAHEARLAQAVNDGKLTQTQADQMLKDMEQGKMPGGPGRGHGPGGPRGSGGPPPGRPSGTGIPSTLGTTSKKPSGML